MGTRSLDEINRRAIQKTGNGSYVITIPKHLIKQLRWQVRQDVEFEIRGQELVIKDAPAK